MASEPTLRRAHGKIESLEEDERNQIADWLCGTHRLTYQEISDELHEMGHEISKSAVGRYAKRVAPFLEHQKQVQDMATQALTTLNRAGIQIDEANMALARNLIFEALASADKQEVESCLDLVRVLNASARFEAVRIQSNKLEMTVEKANRRAEAKISERIRQRLKRKPKLLEQILEEIRLGAQEAREEELA